MPRCRRDKKSNQHLVGSHRFMFDFSYCVSLWCLLQRCNWRRPWLSIVDENANWLTFSFVHFWKSGYKLVFSLHYKCDSWIMGLFNWAMHSKYCHAKWLPRYEVDLLPFVFIHKWLISLNYSQLTCRWLLRAWASVEVEAVSNRPDRRWPLLHVSRQSLSSVRRWCDSSVFQVKVQSLQKRNSHLRFWKFPYFIQILSLTLCLSWSSRNVLGF